MSSNFTLVENTPGKGALLQATSSIPIGQSVFSGTLPYIHVISSSEADKRCHHCFTARDELLRCSRCKVCQYCDAKCQKKAWEAWHKQECAAFVRLGNIRPTDSIILMSRLLWRRKKEFTSTVAPSDPINTFATVKRLKSQREKFSPEKIEQFGQMAAMVASVVGQECASSISEIIDLFCLFITNNYNIQDEEMKPIGIGLYPICALINHSCRPNCVAMFDGTKCSIRVIEPISPGQEITISYIEVATPTAVRQKELKEHFFFDCTCEKCLDKELDDQITRGIPGAFNPTDKSAADALFDSGESLVAQIKADEAVEKFEKAVAIYSKIFGWASYKTHECCKALADLCIQTARWEEALKWSLKLVDYYELSYQPLWPILGIQYFMIGKLLHFMLKTEESMAWLNKAYRVISVTHKNFHLLESLRMKLQEGRAELEMLNRQARLK